MNRTNCREALARLFEFLDGELTPESAESIRHHLEICQACYPSFCFAQAFRDTLRRAACGQPAAPAHLREKIAALLRAEGLDPDA